MSNQVQEPASPPVENFSSPASDMRVENGRELLQNPGFAKSLTKALEKGQSSASQSEKSDLPEPKSKQPTEKDPIAAANAKADAPKTDKSNETKEPEVKKELSLGKRSSTLLSDALDEKGKKPETEAKADKKTSDEKPSDSKPSVSDDEIEQELKTPKSEKSQRRFQELHRRWKEAESKEATTAKQLQEKDKKLAEIEKKMQELASKAPASDSEEIKAKLERLQQYERQYEVENSEDYKRFQVGMEQSESEILGVLKSAGILFKDMNWDQTEAAIKKYGSFAAFQKANPEVAEKIRDYLNPSENDEVLAAISHQKLLEKAKNSYLAAEKSKAKEYFEAKAKEDAAKKAEQPDRKAIQAQAIEQIKSEVFTKIPIFSETSIPEGASAEERRRIEEENKFSAELRDTFQAHLSPQSDEDMVDTALAATIAHRLKRENTQIKQELKKLREENEKIKNGSRTSAKHGAALTAPPDRKEKPAPNFGASLERALERRGSA